MDVESTEIASLERQELEALRLLAVEQKVVADIQAPVEAKRRRKGGDGICLQEGILDRYLAWAEHCMLFRTGELDMACRSDAS